MMIIGRCDLASAASVLCCCLQVAVAGEGGGERSFTPSCPADVSPPSGDGVVNVNDLLAVINGWGACPTPCPPFCVPDVDHSCTVNVNDLLAVINGWGACPCPADNFEPNENCASVRVLPTIGSNQLLTITSANLHGPNDQDFFRINAQETDSTCSCCDGGFCFDEDFQLIVRLVVPAASSVAYRLCSHFDCASVATNCTLIPPGQQGQIVFTFDGACPGQDNYSVFVRISPNGPADPGCANYSLSYQFIPGCF